MANKIMNWYQAKIFPWLMNKNLSSEEIKLERKSILSYAKGEILEIGIGTGNNLPFYPKQVKKITAIDSYIRTIKTETMEVDIKPYSSEDMKFADNSFDVVVSTFCLCSVNDVEKTLMEIKRVLRPGGQLLLLEHGRAEKKYAQGIQKIGNPFFNILACGCNINRDYFTALKEQGFRLEKKSYRKCKIQPAILAGYLYKAIAVVDEE